MQTANFALSARQPSRGARPLAQGSAIAKP